MYYRGWPFPLSIGIYGFAHFVRVVADTLGYFPGRSLSFGLQEARRLIRDWTNQGLTGGYDLAGNTTDFEELLTALVLPVLAISFTDDSYAPLKAVSNLLVKMPLSKTTHLRLSPQELGADRLGHFGCMKDSELVAARIATWIHSAGNDPEVV